MKAMADISKKNGAPPGTLLSASASTAENPDCVRAQAMLVAAPIISKMAPDREAVETKMV